MPHPRVASTLAIVVVAASIVSTASAQRGAGRAAEAARIAGLRVSIWRPDGRGNAPLVVFSHGFHGTGTQSTFLTKALAAAGYLVVAPDHKDAIGPGRVSDRPEASCGRPDTWTDATYRDRADDIRALVAALKADRQWSDAIDWSRVAFAGHSLGGYTVLGVAGGWPAWRLQGVTVKAVLALSPYAPAPFLREKTLASLGVPVMYQGGTRDVVITPMLRRSGGAYDSTSAPAHFVEFRDAGHFAWTDLEAPFQASINAYAIAFFDRYVKGDSAAGLTTRRADVVDLRGK